MGTQASTPPVFPASWAESAVLGSLDLVDIVTGWFTTGIPQGSVAQRGFFNRVYQHLFNGLRYYMQRGAPDWQAGEFYTTGAIQRDATTGLTYQLLTASPAGTSPAVDTANWTPYPAISSWYGDGSDGVSTIGTSTQFGGVTKNFTNLTVNAPLQLYDSARSVNGVSIIRVQGTLTIGASGNINCNGNAGASTLGGQGTSEWFNEQSLSNQFGNPIGNTFGTFLGGGASGCPGMMNPLNFPRGNFEKGWRGDIPNGGSANGGSGGAGTTGGGGGTAFSPQTGGIAYNPFTGDQSDLLLNLYMPGMVVLRPYAHVYEMPQVVPLMGGAGGGGGGGFDNGAGTQISGGAGGAGGGVVLVFARSIVANTASAIRALGGNGGGGTGSSGLLGAGGGGGGGGGRVIVFCRDFTGTALTTACVAGGSGGAATAGATAGSAGSTGKFSVFTGV